MSNMAPEALQRLKTLVEHNTLSSLFILITKGHRRLHALVMGMNVMVILLFFQGLTNCRAYIFKDYKKQELGHIHTYTVYN